MAGEDGDVGPRGGDGEVRVGAGPALSLPLRELEATEAALCVVVIPIVEVLELGLEVGVQFGAARLEEAPRELVLVVGDLGEDSISSSFGMKSHLSLSLRFRKLGRCSTLASTNKSHNNYGISSLSKISIESPT